MVFTGYDSIFFQNKIKRVDTETCTFVGDNGWTDAGKTVTYGHSEEKIKIVAPYESLMWKS